MQSNTDRESRMFPDSHKDRITCHDITRDFLIYGTEVTVLTSYVYTHVYVSAEYLVGELV